MPEAPMQRAVSALIGLFIVQCITAKTLERDVFGLIALYQEVHGRDDFWKGAVEKWPIHTCNVNGECGIDPCGFESLGNSWEGISCRYQGRWDKAVPRVVTNVHLPKRHLTGPLPEAIILLRNLTEYDMDTNELSGPLPKTMGCLTNLMEIDLSDNRLEGTIPQEWGLLHGLVEMELDENNLWGCVPRGLPPFEQFCGGWWGPRCPTFTTDPMIGTSVRGTSIPYGMRCGASASDSQLAAGLRCPVPADFKASIEAYFQEQGVFSPTTEQSRQLPAPLTG